MFNKKDKIQTYVRQDGSKVVDERHNKSKAVGSLYLKFLSVAFTFLIGVSGFFITRWIDSVGKQAEATEERLEKHIEKTSTSDIKITNEITELKVESKNQTIMLNKIDDTLESLRNEILHQKYKNS